MIPVKQQESDCVAGRVASRSTPGRRQTTRNFATLRPVLLC